MKRVFYLFIFAIMPKLASAQLDTAIIVFELDTPTVRYYLDTIRIDSFFLLEQTSVPGGGPRPDVFYHAMYFTDTTAFNLYINSIDEQITQLGNQFNTLKLQREVFAYRKERLEYLRDSIFRGVTGITEVKSVKPPPAEPLQAPQPTIDKTKAVFPSGKKQKKQR